MANILLLLLCASLLQGCGTFFYPSRTTIGTGAYTEKDWLTEADEYYYGSGVGYATLNYSDIHYYPWWSLDYYYFGPHYYRPFYRGYRSGWYTSLGFNFAYPPYYLPYGFYGPVYYHPHLYYGRYDPWYRLPGHGIGLNVFWSDVYWYKRFNHHVTVHHHPGRHEYGNSRYGYIGPREDVHLDPRFRAQESVRMSNPDGTRAVSRSVSMAPSAGDQDRGMEVRSRRERKIRESHIGPAPVQPASPARGPSAKISGLPPASPSVVSPPRVIRQVQPPQSRSPGPGRERPSAPPPRAAPRPPSRPAVGRTRGPGPGHSSRRSPERAVGPRSPDHYSGDRHRK